jgi:hypothetical protein
MNFKELKCKIKQEQKDLAKDIRLAKHLRKPKNIKTEKDRQLAGSSWFDSYQFRHRHIVYCMLFNKTPYEKIEIKCREKPSSKILEKLKTEWTSKLDEALRDNT